MSKWVTKSGKKYRVDGEFYIAKDESHIIYRDVKYNWFSNYYRRHHFSGEIPSNLQRAVWVDHFGSNPGDLTRPFKNAHPDIPWKQMTAMRNILIHEYFGVNVGTVWQTVQARLPILKQHLLALTK